uniref:GIMAP family P-loop NTPase domain containing 1 n=1 Tax=Scleropages formosus TaxID=113540 RepID=A0A8C9RZJ9_SCLFO
MGTDLVESQTVALDVLLLGTLQSGKSSTGNMLLGSRDFRTGLSLGAVTRDCQLRRRVFPAFLRRHGDKASLDLRVLDTPGYPNSLRSPGIEKQIVAEAVKQAFAGGPHIVALVVRVDVPFCEDGHHLSHAMLVLSHAGNVDQAGVDREEYLRLATGPFHALLTSLEHRHHFVENSSPWLQMEGKPLLERLLLLSRRNQYRRLQLRVSE